MFEIWVNPKRYKTHAKIYKMKDLTYENHISFKFLSKKGAY